VKYDLATGTKATQLPAVFANLTDIHSSVDTGKVAGWQQNSRAISKVRYVPKFCDKA